MSRRAVIALAAAVALLAMGAVVLYVFRPRTHDCTLAGCEDTVALDLATLGADTRGAAVSAKFCANSQCTMTRLDRGQSFLSIALDDRTVRSGSLSITDVAGRELARFELSGEYVADEWRPNGPDCEPTCWRLILGIVDGSLKRETDEQVRAHGNGTR